MNDYLANELAKLNGLDDFRQTERLVKQAYGGLLPVEDSSVRFLTQLERLSTMAFQPPIPLYESVVRHTARDFIEQERHVASAIDRIADISRALGATFLDQILAVDRKSMETLQPINPSADITTTIPGSTIDSQFNTSAFDRISDISPGVGATFLDQTLDANRRLTETLQPVNRLADTTATMHGSTLDSQIDTSAFDRIADISRGMGATFLDQTLDTNRRFAESLQSANGFADVTASLRVSAFGPQLDAFTQFIGRQIASVAAIDDLAMAAAHVGAFGELADDFDVDELEVGANGELTYSGVPLDRDEVTRAVAEVMAGLDGTAKTLRDLVDQLRAALAHTVANNVSAISTTIAVSVVASVVANVLTIWLLFKAPWLAPEPKNTDLTNPSACIKQPLGQMRVGADHVRVHEFAELGSDVIGELDRDSVVIIDEWENGWAHVEYTAGDAKLGGWIVGGFLKPKAE